MPPCASWSGRSVKVGRRTLALSLALAMAAATQDRTADIRVDVDLVPVACSVTDHGVPVKGLRQADFRLREDSIAQQIDHFWQESDLPLTIALLVDVSASQASLIHKHRKTVAHFLEQVVHPEDRAMIVSFGTRVWLNVDMTNSIGDLMQAIDGIGARGQVAPRLGDPCRDEHPYRVNGRVKMKYPCGGTVLWNAVYYTSKLKMRDVTGRKALLILSDGMDTGSDRSLTDAIEAAQSAGTAVYTIKFVDPAFAVLFPVIAFKHSMQRLSDETGAVAFGMLHGDLNGVFRQIEEELRNQYVVAYRPTNRAHDGSFRKLEVAINGRPNLQVRARKGYRAPLD